jgi:hypothetical protein
MRRLAAARVVVAVLGAVPRRRAEQGVMDHDGPPGADAAACGRVGTMEAGGSGHLSPG